MKLREEIVQRALAVGNPEVVQLSEPLSSGWTFDCDDWPQTTQLAVDAVMDCANALLDMVLRLAEAVDELRDAPDV
jgi:hypothetical protein